MPLRFRIEIIIIVLISILVFTTSCLIGKEVPLSPELTTEPQPTWTPNPLIIDTGLAYGIPCRPPCWQGLTPGKTTRQEATQIIQKLVADKQVDHIIEHPEGFFVYVVPSARGNIFVRFEDDILESIHSQIEFYYPIGALVEQFGSPERLYLTDKSDDRTSENTCKEWEPPKPLTAPVISMPVHLLYLERGLYFLMLQPLNGGYICPEMPVTFFCYYNPVPLSEAIRNHWADLCGGGPDVTSEEELSKWHGFGDGY